MNDTFKKHGFTLVELLIVITILGILAAAAIPRLFPQTEKARVAEALQILSAIRQGEEAYFLRNGQYAPRIGPGSGGTTWRNNFGIENPNDDPNRFFMYAVRPLNNNTEFEAAAIRRAGIKNPSNNYTGSISINQNGQFICTESYVQFCPA